jgi:excisionase family DNA binding protein
MALRKVPQVAETLSASISTVYQLIDSGQLPAIKIGARGGGVRVDERDLEVFIQTRRIAPSPPPRTRRRNGRKLRHLHL